MYTGYTTKQLDALALPRAAEQTLWCVATVLVVVMR